MSAFRARLQARLNYDEDKMKQIEVSVLTQHEFRPIARDTDEPWVLIADDLKNVWTCLGLYDPVLKKVHKQAAPADTVGQTVGQTVRQEGGSSCRVCAVLVCVVCRAMQRALRARNIATRVPCSSARRALLTRCLQCACICPCLLSHLFVICPFPSPSFQSRRQPAHCCCLFHLLILPSPFRNQTAGITERHISVRSVRAASIEEHQNGAAPAQ